MYDPKQHADYSYCPENKTFIALDVSQYNFQDIAEEVSAGPYDDSPNQCADGIEENKSSSPNRAHADDKGYHRTQPVEKPEPKDQRGLKSCKQPLCLIDPFLPRRKPGQEPLTMGAAQVKNSWSPQRPPTNAARITHGKAR